jgi:hypothetical protein
MSRMKGSSSPPAHSPTDSFVHFREDELNRPIYRFMAFQRLVEIMTTRRLTMMRTDLWDDPWENYITHVKFRIGRATTQFNFRRTVYGSCWTRKSVSDALWRIYSPDKLAIRIASTPRLLGTALKAGIGTRSKASWFVGRVQYLAQGDIAKQAGDIAYDIASDRSGKGAARSVLFKRRSFAHEDEVRVLAIDHGSSRVRGGILRVKVDPQAIIRSVMLDSRTPKEVADMYSTYLKNELGFRGRIARSTLYDLPKALEVDLIEEHRKRYPDESAQSTATRGS